MAYLDSADSLRGIWRNKIHLSTRLNVSWELQMNLIYLVACIKIARCHNLIVGYYGVQSTLTKIAEYLKTTKKEEPWTYMQENVRIFIKRSLCCQKMRRLKVLMHTPPFTTATYAPMPRIAVDTIGP
jgi:hypothetical protein